MAVIIDGSSGITSVNGSAAAPSVTGTDTDTGIVYGTNTLSLATGGTTAVTVDSSQNVGIGAAPLGWSGSKSLTLLTPSGSVYTSLFTVGNTVGLTSNAYYNGTNWIYGINYNAQQYYMGDGAHIWRTASASTGTISWSESMRIDSSGNVGIGTSTPATFLDVTKSQNAATRIRANNQTNGASALSGLDLEAYGGGWTIDTPASGTFTNPLVFSFAGTGAGERMRIDSIGRVGIGTDAATAKLHVSATSGEYFRSAGKSSAAVSADVTISRTSSSTGIVQAPNLYFDDGTTNYTRAIQCGVGNLQFWAYRSGWIEDMRIDTSGNVLFGTSNFSLSASSGFKINGGGSTTPYVGQVFDTAGGYNTYHLFNVNATNNGYRFYVTANGGVYNYSGNNTNLSDERTKTNIELSGGYLEKICAIPVKLFNYKDEPENEQRTLGVIAQDVEAVAPELVNQDGWLGEAPEGEAPLKSIYTTDMMFALMKAIQEQQAIIEQLKADVAELKAAK